MCKEPPSFHPYTKGLTSQKTVYLYMAEHAHDTLIRTGKTQGRLMLKVFFAISQLCFGGWEQHNSSIETDKPTDVITQGQPTHYKNLD